MGITLKQNWSESSKLNIHSQHGEDGILLKIFDLIGIKHRYAVECGALNGVHLSNTRHFIVDHNWRALLIEADPTAFEKLCKNYADNAQVICLNSFIDFSGVNTIDTIFAAKNVPIDLDLFVLDIDGNEYHIWDSMNKFRPRVMIIEFNQTIPNDILFIQPRDMKVQQGSSLRALNELAKSKNYQLVAATDCNAFFVANEIAEPFKHLDNSLNAIRPVNAYETKIFQLYDGTLKIDGYKKLLWHNIEIDEEALQVLPKSRRIFLNGINSNERIRVIKHYFRQSKLYPVIRFLRKNPYIRKIIK